MKEKPKPASWRVYIRHRKIVRALKKKRGGSEAENVRISLENEAQREGLNIR